MPILDQYGQPIATQRRSRFRELLAKYDAAQTTDENMRHWEWADNLSAAAANSAEVRKKLRERSRYEAANNGYARSMVDVLAADTVGTGPRVQIRTGNTDADERIEHEWNQWCGEVHLAQKLRTLRKAKAVDGEAVAKLSFREKLPTPVKLFVRPVEADQLTTPHLIPWRDNELDGIELDGDGEPLAYWLLKRHPGDTSFWGDSLKAERYNPSSIVHLFRADRPGQYRGIPELTPALRLFSQLRRYTLAVLAAAETAADFAAVIQTSNPPGTDGLGPDDSGGVSAEALDTFELAQRMVTVLPDGYSLGQIKAEQPTTTYGEFKREILAEAFAALCMPYNVGAHDSAGSNFASSKLDRITYARVVGIEQSEWANRCVLPLFGAWYDEAALIPGYLPDGVPPMSWWKIVVHWDCLDDVEPAKAATAHQTEIESFQRSLPAIYARRGEDWETEAARNADALGLALDEYKALVVQKLFKQPQPATQPQEVEDAA